MRPFCALLISALLICLGSIPFSCSPNNTQPLSPGNPNNPVNPNNPNDTNHQYNPPHPSQTFLSRLDISNAKTLFIVKPNALAKQSGAAATDSFSTLFKVTPEGVAIQVTCFGISVVSRDTISVTVRDSIQDTATITVHDTTGDTVINQISPINLCNLSDNFLTVTFMGYGTYLVRKSDGAVFKGSKLPVSGPDPTMDRPDLGIQQDGFGNIYYMYGGSGGGAQEVLKLTVQDPANLTVSTYSASGDVVGWNDFVVDKAGNMVYNTRYRHALGGFEDNINISYGAGWTNFANDSIFEVDPPDGTGRSRILKIIPSSPLTFELYGDTVYPSNIDPMRRLVKIKNKQKIIGVSNAVYDLYNPNGVISQRPFSYFNITNIKVLAASDNYYYILGTNAALQSVLLKVDPTGHTYTNLLTTGDYVLYSLVVGASDQVQFYALRMSDGKRVLAQLDSAGAVTIVAVLDGSTVIALERIN